MAQETTGLVNSLRSALGPHIIGLTSAANSIKQTSVQHGQNLSKIVKDIASAVNSHKTNIDNISQSIDEQSSAIRQTTNAIGDTNTLLQQSIQIQQQMLNYLKSISQETEKNKTPAGEGFFDKFSKWWAPLAGAAVGGAAAAGAGALRHDYGMVGGEGAAPAHENQKMAMDYFTNQGWSKEQAAGIVGNLMAESGHSLSPTATGDNMKAFGVAQWHPDRQADFKKWSGKDIRESTLQEQLGFVNYELTQGKEQKAGNLLKQAKTAGEAASVVDQHYERSSGEHRQKRIGYAAGLVGGDQQQQPQQQQQRFQQGASGSNSNAVQIASTMIGANRQQASEYLAKGGYQNKGEAWCAEFVNSSLKQSGVKGSGSAIANSFQKWGQQVKPEYVRSGDVVVITRGKSAEQTGGHVGLATGNYQNGQIEIIAGNTQNQVRKYFVPVTSQVMVRRSDGQNIAEQERESNKQSSDIPGTSGGGGMSISPGMGDMSPGMGMGMPGMGMGMPFGMMGGRGMRAAGLIGSIAGMALGALGSTFVSSAAASEAPEYARPPMAVQESAAPLTPRAAAAETASPAPGAQPAAAETTKAVWQTAGTPEFNKWFEEKNFARIRGLYPEGSEARAWTDEKNRRAQATRPLTDEAGFKDIAPKYFEQYAIDEKKEEAAARAAVSNQQNTAREAPVANPSGGGVNTKEFDYTDDSWAKDIMGMYQYGIVN